VMPISSTSVENAPLPLALAVQDGTGTRRSSCWDTADEAAHENAQRQLVT
jgi:hypothetical protein